MAPENLEKALLLFAMLFLSVTIFACLIRAIMGPRLTDRVVAMNMIGVKAMLLIAIVAVYLGEPYLVDVALVYALLSFLAVVVLTKFVMQFKGQKQNMAQNGKVVQPRNEHT